VPVPVPAPAVGEVFDALPPKRFRTVAGLWRRHGVSITQDGRYRHWERVRRLRPPEGLSTEEWWLGIKLARSQLFRALPFTDANGEPFVYCMPDEAHELLHFVTQHASGEVAIAEPIIEDETARRRYLVNSLIEEAIRSSQLEGASTTRRVAKEMIRSGRAPRDRSEQMILNNYRALEFLREDVGDRLSPDIVLELHRILTDGTLDDPDAAGRLQTPADERIAVWDDRTDELVHAPPPAEQLEGRLELLCRFASGEVGATGFLHPVMRAIILHFMLAYDHPFEDGNGRTARALFYWSMRQQGYWLTEYLSISRILREGPVRYSRAFSYTETDENDLTYFVLFHLAVVKRAIEELHRYLERKVREVREVERLVRQSDRFNHRQLALLGDAVRHPDHRYTFASHARSHRVSMQSARNDLLSLAKQGLLERRRAGRRLEFTPVADLARKVS
jgi:Fic family protein